MPRTLTFHPKPEPFIVSIENTTKMIFQILKQITIPVSQVIIVRRVV